MSRVSRPTNRCLEDHSNDDGFGAGCRSLVYDELKLQVGSLKFNAPVRAACAEALVA